jgi:A/G-specific adenine glycosylase
MNRSEKQFVKKVWAYYKTHGRHGLLWRRAKDPYKILVSEIMLQQTQVERVLPKYKAFLRRFPNIKVLAKAPLKDVLSTWQGLGYNRRAKMLHECAKYVLSHHKARLPKTHGALMALPGIGPYTASAVMAFAYNTPSQMIETNIRSVYIHHFFNDDYEVHDKELLLRIEHTLDRDNPREWFYALMDYGAYIKKTFGNPNKRSAHHKRQSTFIGSNRQIRGAIIRILAEGSYTRRELLMKLQNSKISE